jgi:hypothetical protein
LPSTSTNPPSNVPEIWSTLPPLPTHNRKKKGRGAVCRTEESADRPASLAPAGSSSCASSFFWQRRRKISSAWCDSSAERQGRRSPPTLDPRTLVTNSSSGKTTTTQPESPFSAPTSVEPGPRWSTSSFLGSTVPTNNSIALEKCESRPGGTQQDLGDYLVARFAANLLVYAKSTAGFPPSSAIGR